MKIVTAKEMQEIDRIAITEYGIPGEVLMGYAGKAIADFIIQNCGNAVNAAVFCGSGNNGGDGFVIGYLLWNKGIGVKIYLVGNPEKISPASKIYYDICRNADISIVTIADENALKDIEIEHRDLIVDAMLGTGFTGEARGIVPDVIRKINEHECPVFCVDIPSGVSSNGNVSPDACAVRADFTVTMGLPKISHVTYPGKMFTGMLHVVDIGFPSVLTESDDIKIDLIDNDFVKRHLNTERDADTHKNAEGHILP